MKHKLELGFFKKWTDKQVAKSKQVLPDNKSILWKKNAIQHRAIWSVGVGRRDKKSLRIPNM